MGRVCIGALILCVTSSGIAALPLLGGRTSHSRFKIPLLVHESSVCSITKTSHLADILRKAALIIWDEVPMQHEIAITNPAAEYADLSW